MARKFKLVQHSGKYVAIETMYLGLSFCTSFINSVKVLLREVIEGLSLLLKVGPLIVFAVRVRRLHADITLASNCSFDGRVDLRRLGAGLHADVAVVGSGGFDGRVVAVRLRADVRADVTLAGRHNGGSCADLSAGLAVAGRLSFAWRAGVARMLGVEGLLVSAMVAFISGGKLVASGFVGRKSEMACKQMGGRGSIGSIKGKTD